MHLLNLIKAIEAMYGSLAPRALALYGLRGTDRAQPDTLYGRPAAQWVVDTMYRCPVVAQLYWHAVAGNTTYEYQFDRAAPGREGAGAVHGTEVPYVFGAVHSESGGVKYTAVDREISAAMQQYWTNFARTGDPNGVANVPNRALAAAGINPNCHYGRNSIRRRADTSSSPSRNRWGVRDCGVHSATCISRT
jgi:carboxylesterase type B